MTLGRCRTRTRTRTRTRRPLRGWRVPLFSCLLCWEIASGFAGNPVENRVEIVPNIRAIYVGGRTGLATTPTFVCGHTFLGGRRYATCGLLERLVYSNELRRFPRDFCAALRSSVAL